MMRSTEAISWSKAFATLRFCGDRLDPGRITAILGVEPTKAYRKGQRYFAGPRAGYVLGRTGVWVFATDRVLDSAELDEHLEYLVGLVFDGVDRERRLRTLRKLMSDDGLKADVSCFWRGGPGTQAPTVSEGTIRKLGQLPAEIETDFEISED